MEDKRYTPPRKIYAYLHKGFPDDSYPPHEYIQEILSFIEKHLNKSGKVLVHCSMGISRSGGIIVAWLLKKNPKWGWRDAVSYVKRVKFIAPAVEIRESILDYFEKSENQRRSY